MTRISRSPGLAATSPLATATTAYRRAASLIAGGATLTLLLVTAALQRPQAIVLPLADGPFNHASTGWNAVERTPDGSNFRWSGAESVVRLRAAPLALPANRPLMLTMTFGARPASAPGMVELTANGVVIDRWAATTTHPVTLNAASLLHRGDDLVLAVRVMPFTPRGDNRVLGVPLLSAVSLTAASGFALPRLTLALYALALTALAALMAGPRAAASTASTASAVSARLIAAGIMLALIVGGLLTARVLTCRLLPVATVALTLVVAVRGARAWWPVLAWPVRALQRRLALADGAVLAVGAMTAVGGQAIIASHRPTPTGVGGAVGAVALAVGLWLLLVPLVAPVPVAPTVATAGDGPETAQWARQYGWWIALLGIVVVALGLRFALLTEIPASLFRDEGRHALRAAKLLDDPTYRPVYEADIDLPALFLYPLAGAFKLFGVSLMTLRGFMAVMGALSVALLGVLGRQLFGPRVGLIAASLFAASFWGLRMGRVGLIPSFSTAVVLLALVLFVRALHTRRYTDFALAGVVAAGCANVYHSSPFALFLMLGVAVALIVRGPQAFVRQWLGRFALFAVCCLVGLAPLLGYIAGHTAAYLYRPGQTSALAEANLRRLGQDRLAAFTDNVPPNLGMYTVRGDHEPKLNLPFAPHLDALTAVALLAGLALALAGRVPQQRAIGGDPSPSPSPPPLPPGTHLLGGRFVVAWLAAMLIPSLLAIDAPNTLRAFDTLPPALLLAALAFNRVLQTNPPRFPPFPDHAGAFRDPRFASVALALCAVLALNAGTYFGLMRTDRQETLRFESYFVSQAGRQMIAEAAAHPGIVFYLPRATIDRDVVPFFARVLDGKVVIHPLEEANAAALPARYAIFLPTGADDPPPTAALTALPWARALPATDGPTPAGASAPAFVEYHSP